MHVIAGQSQAVQSETNRAPALAAFLGCKSGTRTGALRARRAGLQLDAAGHFQAYLADFIDDYRVSDGKSAHQIAIADERDEVVAVARK